MEAKNAMSDFHVLQGRLKVTAQPAAAGGLANTSFKVSIYTKPNFFLFSTVLSH
jgi:hypothetical protein